MGKHREGNLHIPTFKLHTSDFSLVAVLLLTPLTRQKDPANYCCTGPWKNYEQLWNKRFWYVCVCVSILISIYIDTSKIWFTYQRIKILTNHTFIIFLESVLILTSLMTFKKGTKGSHWNKNSSKALRHLNLYLFITINLHIKKIYHISENHSSIIGTCWVF